MTTALLAAILALTGPAEEMPPPDGPYLATATVVVKVEVVAFAFVTNMRVQPRAIQPRSAVATVGAGAPGTPVLIKIDLPAAIVSRQLVANTFTLNGYPVTLINTIYHDSPEQKKVYLYLRRTEFITALNGAVGPTEVTLEAEIGGGHRLVASDVITVLPAPGESHP